MRLKFVNATATDIDFFDILFTFLLFSFSSYAFFSNENYSSWSQKVPENSGIFG